MSEGRLHVAYLGPEATFTHQAAWKAFGGDADYLAAGTVDEVFSLVAEGKADRGVAPVENSNEGVVTSTLDLLSESPLVIVGEAILPIRLMLISRQKDLAGVRTVYSHPQALAQSRRFLHDNLPNAQLREARSTADAVSAADRQDGAAAVAGELAASLYRVPVLRADIGDYKQNLTRFLIVSREPCARTGDDKTSLLFTIKDRVGALYEILRPFGENGINLTKIESRPSRRRAWDYVFFVDIDGHREDPIVRDVLRKVREFCVELKVLGSYPRQAFKEQV